MTVLRSRVTAIATSPVVIKGQRSHICPPPTQSPRHTPEINSCFYRLLTTDIISHSAIIYHASRVMNGV